MPLAILQSDSCWWVIFRCSHLSLCEVDGNYIRLFVSPKHHLTVKDMLVLSCWQEEWSVSAITTMLLFSDPSVYLRGATSHTFYRLAGQNFKWPFCQPFHVVRTSRPPHLPNTENDTCNNPEVTSVLTQRWPMPQTKTCERTAACPGKRHVC